MDVHDQYLEWTWWCCSSWHLACWIIWMETECISVYTHGTGFRRKHSSSLRTQLCNSAMNIWRRPCSSTVLLWIKQTVYSMIAIYCIAQLYECIIVYVISCILILDVSSCKGFKLAGGPCSFRRWISLILLHSLVTSDCMRECSAGPWWQWSQPKAIICVVVILQRQVMCVSKIIGGSNILCWEKN